MLNKLNSIPLVEVLRNQIVESLHFGIAVIVDYEGNIIAEWGDSDTLIFPRSAMKMIQALPLVESGAIKEFSLGKKEVALACASHQGSLLHTEIIESWLAQVGCNEMDLRCGVQPPSSSYDRQNLRDMGLDFTQLNNNCSGKHAGFLTLSQFYNFSHDYIEVRHPVQKKVRTTLEELSEEKIRKHGTDGCSAPNFMCSIKGLAKALGKFSYPESLRLSQRRAIHFLTESMYTYPELVAGKNRACTELMLASNVPIIVKTGAEGVFVAAVPQKKVGVALKIFDGSTRASEAAIAAILVKLGALDQEHPLVKKRLFRPIQNWNGDQTGVVRPVNEFWANGTPII